MCVYRYVCSSITLECLEQFQPNLVQIYAYIIKMDVCVCLIEDWDK
jgi:hypothetical protein